MAEIITTRGGIAQPAVYAVYPLSLGTIPPDTGLTGTVSVKNNFLDPSVYFFVGFMMLVYDPEEEEYAYVTFKMTMDTTEATYAYGTLLYNIYPPAQGSEKEYDIETYAMSWSLSGLDPPYTYGCLAFVAEQVNTRVATHTVDEDKRTVGVLYENVSYQGTDYIGFVNFNLYDTELYGDQFTVQRAATITGFSLSKA